VTGADGTRVGTWPLAAVEVTPVAQGPPRSFVLEVPGSVQLLAAPAGPGTDAVLTALGAPTSPAP
jgi:hypothetical protein